MKRTAAEAELQESDQRKTGQEAPWTDVVRGNRGRRPRPVQQGTAKTSMAGAEAAPFDIVIGNTHPESTEDIVKDVLIKVADAMEGEFKLEEKLHIIEVEYLTKPREDGRRFWSKYPISLRII